MSVSDFITKTSRHSTLGSTGCQPVVVGSLPTTISRSEPERQAIWQAAKFYRLAACAPGTVNKFLDVFVTACDVEIKFYPMEYTDAPAQVEQQVSVDTIQCPYCGHTLPANATVCDRCDW